MDPKDARSNNGMGVVLGQLGKPGDAIPYFRKAASLDENFFEAYYNLGVVLARQNRLDEAVDAWQNVVRIRPRFAQGHENLGYALYKRSRFADALAQFRLALADDPNRIFALRQAASLLATCPDSSVRNGAEAVTLAGEANRLSGGKDATILDTLSAAYAEAGDFAQATATEQQAFTLASADNDAALAARLKLHLARYASNQPLRIAPDAAAF
jgi:tetratricopeptide (TPR) repeat protein